MARSQQYVDGYRKASRDAVSLLHQYAERMADARAKGILNAAAFSLGNDALRATPEVIPSSKEAGHG